jgi:hypothetical protein
VLDQGFDKLPGAEIVLPGIEDLKAGRGTINALAVSAAAVKLGCARVAKFTRAAAICERSNH